MATIIGRKQEIQELESLYNSDESQFVAIYGRCRVGKTFLVDEALKGKITFRHAGLSPVDENGKKNLLKDQLKHFFNSLRLHGMKKGRCPSSWLDAFFLLEQHLQNIDNGTRQVVFLDELPWMDTPKSGFMTAFEAFWNSWGCHRDNLMVVVCGSANSWILDNLINSHGGLYDRTKCDIKLNPFTFKETEDFFKAKGILLSQYDILQTQMVLGGIPYYLGYFKKGYSFAQNVDRLFWSDEAKLKDEFDRLFSSIFSNPEEMKRIVMTLTKRRKGFTRKDLAETLGVNADGSFTKKLKALIASDFIQKYKPFGESADEYYKLIDPFCIFYSKFVKDNDSQNPYFWSENQFSQKVVSWRGFAFEDFCFRQVDLVKRALGISGVSTEISTWNVKGDDIKEGSQTDLLIKRKDNIVNLCEMKFYSEEYSADKTEYRKMLKRVEDLRQILPAKFTIHPTLVTTFGLKHNEYSGIFQKVVTLEEMTL